MAELSTLGAVIKTAYEAEVNTNAFTDSHKAKVETISTVAMSGSFNDLADIPNLVELDESGTIPMQYLNVSNLSFKGAWNATTNTPTLVDGTGAVGDFYKVSVAGTQNFGNGDYTFAIGDWVMFAAGVWQRIGVHETVTSVNGKTGAVALTAADVGAKPNSYVPTYTEITDKPDLPNLYVPKTDVNKVNGVAPLGSDGKVPLANLPSVIGTGEWVIPKTTYVNVISSRLVGTWYVNNTDYDKDVYINTSSVVGVTPSYIEVRNAAGTTTFRIDATAVGGGSGNIVCTHQIQATVPSGFSYRITLGSGGRTVQTWLEMNQESGSTFVPVSQKGISNGVAPLDVNSRVPFANLPTARTWKNALALPERVIDGWVTVGAKEMIVFVRSTEVTSTLRYLRGQIRENSSAAAFDFRSAVTVTATAQWLTLTLVVPPGWQYQISSTGQTTKSNIETWYEMY